MTKLIKRPIMPAEAEHDADDQKSVQEQDKVSMVKLRNSPSNINLIWYSL